jgi:DNA repair protein RecO (recombination protein O)
MILKDQGIVLRTAPFGNTSRTVVWLTAGAGKIATAAKGSQREKSPFLGQYDLFYTCELLYYVREPRGLHILKECTPIALRTTLRRDWRACSVASYAASLFDRILPLGPADPELFSLLDDTLDDLAERSPGPAFLPRFELRLLRILGLAPDWSRCARCRRDLLLPGISAPATAHLDIKAARLLCPSCAAADAASAEALPLGTRALRILDAITSGRTIPPTLPAAVYREIRQAVGLWLGRHADIPPHARNAALEILENTPPPSPLPPLP